MEEKTSYRSLFLLSIVVSPLLAFFWAAPLLIQMNYFQARILPISFKITSFILVLSSLNILLIRILKNWNNILRISLSIVIIVSIAALFQAIIFQNKENIPNNIKMVGGIVNCFNGLIMIIIHELHLSKSKNIQLQKKYSELNLRQLEARQLHLQNQIQPHFLFNALMTLKSLIKRNPVKAEEFTFNLSTFLRYTLSEDGNRSKLLKEEIDLCLNYLELQNVRFGKAIQYNIDIPDTVLESGRVPMLAIQVLLENAIKHNQLNEEVPLHIHITYLANGRLSVSNNLIPKNSTEHSIRLGLKNLSERYILIGGKEISISKNDQTFTVEIDIL